MNGPHRFSLRGSDYGFSRPRKNLRTRAHARKDQALRRAQRGDFFTPRTGNSLHTGIELRPRGCHRTPSTNRASDLRLRWRNFVRDNKLKENDICIFQPIKGERFRVTVHLLGQASTHSRGQHPRDSNSGSARQLSSAAHVHENSSSSMAT